MIFDLKKASIIKRASAFLLDVILLSVLAAGFMWIISIICDYSGEEALAKEYYAKYDEYESTYKKDLANSFDYVYYSEDGKVTDLQGNEAAFSELVAKLVDWKQNSGTADEILQKAYDDYMALPSVNTVDKQAEYVYSLLFMMTSVGILLAYIVLELIVPLCLKNGQTVGKKVFAIGLVRPDCVKIGTMSLFARTILGKYSIETMFPVLLVFLFLFDGMGLLALILIAALFLTDVILLFATANKTPIHDLIAGTVSVDMATQMIFESEEEMLAKKNASK